MKYFGWIIVLLIAGCNSPENVEKDNVDEHVQEVDSLEFVENVSPLQLIEEEILEAPESPNGYYKRALYYKDKFEYQKAIDDINRAIKLAPDAASLNYAKAEILYAYAIYKGDIAFLDEAKTYLDYTLEMDSANIDALLLLAEYQTAEGETDKAMQNVIKAMKFNDHLPRPYFVKGKIYEVLGNAELAESSYQTAIEMDANYYPAMIQLGMLYANQHNDLAITYYKSAIALKPNSLEAIRNLGLYYHFESRYEEARESFEKMMELDSTYEESYFNMGNTYLGVYQNDFPKAKKDSIIDKALEYFQKAIDLNPNYIQALYNMGLAYQEKGNKEKAKEIYKHILDIETNYQPAIDALNSL